MTEEKIHEDVLKILKDPDLFRKITEDEFDKKIVGELDARKSIFLVANMRNVENLNKATDNLMINAHSGTGKDHISEAIFDFLPEEEKEELIRTTPKVLAYTRNRAITGFETTTWKKTALRLEDASNEVLNDDCFKVISSANPNKINIGKAILKGKVVITEIEGKPSIIMTIADSNPKEEILRRFPICDLDESINQTEAILERQAKFAEEGKAIDYDERIINAQKHLRRIKVKIPFARKLKLIFCPENVIVRTHFPRFLDYIKSSCSFYQYQREQDKEGFFIATKDDYELARLILAKTTSNILMIPLTKLRKDLLSVFEKHNLQRQSIEDLEKYAEIKKINITPEWLRKQLDWLSSKGFLNKDSERRQDEAGKTIPKPVFIFSFNKLQQLVIPEFDKLDEFNSIASNKKNTSNSSFTSNTNRVNEAIELNEVKKCITQNNKGFFLECYKCGKSLKSSEEAEFKQGLAYCPDCMKEKVK